MICENAAHKRSKIKERKSKQREEGKGRKEGIEAYVVWVSGCVCVGTVREGEGARLWAPTLGDAVHDLSRHLEAGGQTGREGRGEVDGHGGGWMDHRVVEDAEGESSSKKSLTGHMALALGARAMHSVAMAMQRPRPRQHPFGRRGRTRAALTDAFDFAQVWVWWRGCRRWWVGVGVGCRRPHGSPLRSREMRSPRCCRCRRARSARLAAALHHPPHPLRPSYARASRRPAAPESISHIITKNWPDLKRGFAPCHAMPCRAETRQLDDPNPPNIPSIQPNTIHTSNSRFSRSSCYKTCSNQLKVQQLHYQENKLLAQYAISWRLRLNSPQLTLPQIRILKTPYKDDHFAIHLYYLPYASYALENCFHEISHASFCSILQDNYYFSVKKYYLETTTMFSFQSSRLLKIL